jgi:hypothetical protein
MQTQDAKQKKQNKGVAIKKPAKSGFFYAR